jgi:hypothetical protein
MQATRIARISLLLTAQMPAGQCRVRAQTSSHAIEDLSLLFLSFVRPTTVLPAALFDLMEVPMRNRSAKVSSRRFDSSLLDHVAAGRKRFSAIAKALIKAGTAVVVRTEAAGSAPSHQGLTRQLPTIVRSNRRRRVDPRLVPVTSG